MADKRWDGSSQVDLTVRKRWDGSAWVDLTTHKRWDGAAWQDITLSGGGGSGLSAIASPGSATGAVTNSSLFTVVTSNSVTVTATGGTAPYTYAWTRVSGDSAPTPSSYTAAGVYWSASVGRDQERTATWRCTVTDAALDTATVDVGVTLIHNSDL